MSEYFPVKFTIKTHSRRYIFYNDFEGVNNLPGDDDDCIDNHQSQHHEHQTRVLHDLKQANVVSKWHEVPTPTPKLHSKLAKYQTWPNTTEYFLKFVKKLFTFNETLCNLPYELSADILMS